MFDSLMTDYHPLDTTFAGRLEQKLNSLNCHANQLLPVHAQDITDNAVISYKNHCVMPRYVDRQYDKLWGQAGAKRGTTINLRYPPMYALRRGDRALPQSSAETFFPVTLGTPTGVDMDFTSQELLLTVDDFVNRFVKKAALPIANGVDSDLAGLYKKVNTYVGTPQVLPNSVATVLPVTERLANNGAPVEGDEWSAVIDYRTNTSLIAAFAGQYNPQAGISRQWESARMFDALGYKWSQDQNIKIHTIGALGGTPVVDNTTAGGLQSGTTIYTRGWSTSVIGILKEGDIVQFAGSTQVKPNSIGLDGSSDLTDTTAMFSVAADVNSDSNGKAIITLNQSMVVVPNVSGGNVVLVNQSPADGAAITIFGSASAYAGLTTRQNLFFNKGAFVLGMVDLPLPGGMDMAARTTDEDTKTSIRFLRGFDITENQFISRLDCLYVVAAPRPQFATRLIG